MDGIPVVGVVALAVVLLVVAGIALLRGRFDGRVRTAVRPQPRARGGFGQDRQEPRTGAKAVPGLPEIGIALPGSAQATVVQFSGEYCAVCPRTRTLLERVLRDHPGVAHLEIDVADHLDAVRVLDIRRTPTVLIADSRGRVLHRVSGMPRESELRHALADLGDSR